MANRKLLNRVSTNPKVMGGKPVIKGTRLSVEYILNLLAHGATIAEILEEYEGLDEADIKACLLFASRSLESASFMPLTIKVNTVQLLSILLVYYNQSVTKAHQLPVEWAFDR
jgi:uncharacterized protein (DUF433 family)